MSEQQEEARPDTQRWRPLSAIQRRVLGVLVEKAKTTPDAYPMSLNAITVGSNQKSNRHPQMNLSGDDVQQALDELREMGAVAEVQSSGRVPKYRHYAYDWLGVDKVESAVITELLLRGEQTLGELRGRAARMEPVADLAALRPVVDSLAEKGLAISLTPTGRGQLVTHNLYQQRELDNLTARLAAGQPAQATGQPAQAASSPAPPENHEALESLRGELRGLHERLAQVEARLQQLEAQHPVS